MKMYLLKFTIKESGKKFFLHQDGSFVGGNSPEQAEYASLNHSAKSISVGGFDVVEVTVEELAKMVGTTVENPRYKILSVRGGLVPFEAVEIVVEKDS